MTRPRDASRETARGRLPRTVDVLATEDLDGPAELLLESESTTRVRLSSTCAMEVLPVVLRAVPQASHTQVYAEDLDTVHGD